MKSRTIGSGGDDADIPTWEAQIDDSDSETGTCIESANLGGGGPVTLNATLTGGHTALLTANDANKIDAPTYAAVTGKARIQANSSAAVDVGTGFTVEKLGLIGQDAFANVSGYQSGANGIVRRCGAKACNFGNVFNSYGGTSTVSNCFALEGGENGFVTAGGTMNAYHCSAVNATYGFRNAAGTFNAYACVAQGAPASGCFAGTIGGDYNVSDDATAPGSSSTKYARNESGWFENETPGSEDFAIVAGKQGWWAANKDAIDQTGWPADVATDIVGTARSAPIDPGVWQGAASTDPPNASYATDTQLCEGSNGTITPANAGGAITSSAMHAGSPALPTGYVLNANGTISKTGASMIAADITALLTCYVDLTNAGGTQSNVPVPLVITANPPVGHWDTANILTTILKATPVATTHDFTHDSGPAVDPDSFAFSPPLTGMSINATNGRVTLTYGRDGDRQNDTRVITFATAGGQVGSASVTIERIFTGPVPCNSGAATWVPVIAWGGGARRTIGHRMAGFPKTGQPNIGAHSTGAPE